MEAHFFLRQRQQIGGARRAIFRRLNRNAVVHVVMRIYNLFRRLPAVRHVFLRAVAHAPDGYASSIGQIHIIRRFGLLIDEIDRVTDGALNTIRPFAQRLHHSPTRNRKHLLCGLLGGDFIGDHLLVFTARLHNLRCNQDGGVIRGRLACPNFNPHRDFPAFKLRQVHFNWRTNFRSHIDFRGNHVFRIILRPGHEFVQHAVTGGRIGCGSHGR